MISVHQCDRHELRKTLGRFPTGVTVLSVGAPQFHGMTVNSFTSVSLDPPLVLVCVASSARMHPLVTQSEFFGLSILAAEHARLARHFASASRAEGAEQFDVGNWSDGPLTSVPLLESSAAKLECQRVACHSAGDHTIIVGEILSFSRLEETQALLFADGGLSGWAVDQASREREATA